MKQISIIVVNYNVKYFLEVCLHSVQRACDGFDAEIIVVDNNSADGSCDMVRRDFPEVILVENKDNRGFSQANNQAVAMARGAYILFLNPDTVMPEDFLRKTIAYMDAHPEAGSLGPRLIDGKGQFAPDSKKSFPTLSVALFKTTGLNKIFSRSAYINKYYAVHVKEYETAEVEVLSGCCMMVRASLLPGIGGAFDEDYFMYCEDVDLSYRIQQAGYKNMYYPEATLIHYKGESTRKASLSYIRIFNEALSTFVRKHYSKRNAALFILLINVGIVLRAVWAFVKNIFRWLKAPLIDALALLALLVFMNHFWVEGFKNMKPVDNNTLYATFPVYILLWIFSMYLNGAYDQPYRALRVLRGMVTGTVIILAYFGILSAEYRYSRAVILFAGTLGAVGLVALREVLNWLGISRFIRYNQVPKRAVIVADEDNFELTADTLEQVHYAPDIVGRIAVSDDLSPKLATVADMKPLLLALNINEVVFCINGLRYDTVLHEMEHCGQGFDYKIHLPGSQSFVGSNSSHSSGDLYTIDKRYNIATFVSARNKRVFDIVAALCVLMALPVLVFVVKDIAGTVANVFRVLWGRRTWIGYDHEALALPPIRKSILPVYTVQEAYEPAPVVQKLAALAYAEQYVVGLDFSLFLKNLKFLGKK